MEKSLFRHSTPVRVRNYEVDWQGIVHNANILLYFEVGRLEYLQQLGLRINFQSIQNESRVVLVRNEIDYCSPAHFNELLNVYSRITYIRHTSFAFEAFIEEAGTDRCIASNVAVHVWLDPKTGEPARVREDFRLAVRQFEGPNVAILDPPSRT